MDLTESTQEFLLNNPQKIYLHTWANGGIPRAKTIDEIFAELASMKWNHFNNISYIWRDDPTHEFLNRLVTVTFIDLTNCDEDDFASDLPIEIIDLSNNSLMSGFSDLR